MDLQFDVEIQGGLLLVTASGSLVFDVALRLLRKCVISQRRNKLTKFL